MPQATAQYISLPLGPYTEALLLPWAGGGRSWNICRPKSLDPGFADLSLLSEMFFPFIFVAHSLINFKLLLKRLCPTEFFPDLPSPSPQPPNPPKHFWFLTSYTTDSFTGLFFITVFPIHTKAPWAQAFFFFWRVHGCISSAHIRAWHLRSAQQISVEKWVGYSY